MATQAKGKKKAAKPVKKAKAKSKSVKKASRAKPVKRVKAKGVQKAKLKAKTGKKRVKKKTPSPFVLLNFRVRRKERTLLNARAAKYARGNLSAWLRLAGARFKPSSTSARA